MWFWMYVYFLLMILCVLVWVVFCHVSYLELQKEFEYDRMEFEKIHELLEIEKEDIIENRYDYEFGSDGYYIIDKDKIEDYDGRYTDEDEYRVYKIIHSLNADEVADLLNSYLNKAKIFKRFAIAFAEENDELKQIVGSDLDDWRYEIRGD